MKKLLCFLGYHNFIGFSHFVNVKGGNCDYIIVCENCYKYKTTYENK